MLPGDSSGSPTRRDAATHVTELEVLRIARAKESLADDAVLTPRASDRTLATGFLRP